MPTSGALQQLGARKLNERKERNMQQILKRNGRSASAMALSLALCWLLPTALLMGCAARTQPSPPVLFKPARVTDPDPALMVSPKPAGQYLTSAQQDAQKWQERLRDSLSKSEGSKPGSAAP